MNWRTTFWILSVEEAKFFGIEAVWSLVGPIKYEFLLFGRGKERNRIKHTWFHVHRERQEHLSRNRENRVSLKWSQIIICWLQFQSKMTKTQLKFSWFFQIQRFPITVFLSSFLNTQRYTHSYVFLKKLQAFIALMEVRDDRGAEKEKDYFKDSCTINPSPPCLCISSVCVLMHLPKGCRIHTVYISIYWKKIKKFDKVSMCLCLWPGYFFLLNILIILFYFCNYVYLYNILCNFFKDTNMLFMFLYHYMPCHQWWWWYNIIITYIGYHHTFESFSFLYSQYLIIKWFYIKSRNNDWSSYNLSFSFY